MELEALRGAAREIFQETLKSVDAGQAVGRALSLEGSRLKVADKPFSLDVSSKGVYAVAIGKAARPMALSLSEILGGRLTAGVITAPKADAGCRMPDAGSETFTDIQHTAYGISRWLVFEGGHPLPNRESMDAARAAFELLRRANEEGAPLLFLISGGGSAMMEWPRDERITLEELREANRILVTCGAGIAEINAVRRAISAVKGGGLARLAPRCDQLSLIVSDTGEGQEDAVASGPTFIPGGSAPDPSSVIAHYGLEKSLPASVLRAVEQHALEAEQPAEGRMREHLILFDNGSALRSAAASARARGFMVEVARDVVEQPVVEGCSLLLSRLVELRRRASEQGRVACLISGGEFACPVRGAGAGGRNSESALRWAIELDALASAGADFSHVVALSAGTDGVDGNSPSAGALADETTLERALDRGMNARRFLDESDAHTFFDSLNDSLMTGPTGTNVRDLRVMLAS